jgi:hypothetical protein
MRNVSTVVGALDPLQLHGAGGVLHDHPLADADDLRLPARFCQHVRRNAVGIREGLFPVLLALA